MPETNIHFDFRNVHTNNGHLYQYLSSAKQENIHLYMWALRTWYFDPLLTTLKLASLFILELLEPYDYAMENVYFQLTHSKLYTIVKIIHCM